MSDEERFNLPLFVLRNGKVAEDNVREFLEWRKRTDPEAYRAAVHKLAEVIVEAAVRQLLARERSAKARPFIGARGAALRRTIEGGRSRALEGEGRESLDFGGMATASGTSRKRNWLPGPESYGDVTV